MACVGISSGISTGIYRSQNSGVTWTLVSNIPDVITIASDGVDHFYAGTFDGNYRSTNNGSAWNTVGPGIPAGEGGFCALALGTHVFIGNSQGVFHSADHGASFTPASDGLDPIMNRSVQGLAASDEFIFAGIHRNGIWRRSLSDFDITTGIPDATPVVAGTLRAWPSPASAEVTVAYNMQRSGRVRFEVFDATGKSVLDPVWEIAIAGEQRRTIPVDALAPGLYVLRLSTPGGVISCPLSIAR